jgi:hypothetical protein
MDFHAKKTHHKTVNNSITNDPVRFLWLMVKFHSIPMLVGFLPIIPAILLLTSHYPPLKFPWLMVLFH